MHTMHTIACSSCFWSCLNSKRSNSLKGSLDNCSEQPKMAQMSTLLWPFRQCILLSLIMITYTTTNSSWSHYTNSSLSHIQTHHVAHKNSSLSYKQTHHDCVKRRLERCSSWKFLAQALNPTGLVGFVVARIQFKPLIIPKLRLTKKGQCWKTSFDLQLNWTELSWNSTETELTEK